jgi:Ca2+-binding RTX toxin-like protein
MSDANVASGQTLSLDLLHAGIVSVNGSAESNGRYAFNLGGGLLHITGGQKDDSFEINGSFYTGGSKINGGAGNDYLSFNFAANFAPLADTLLSIETMRFGGSFSNDPYIVHLNDANTAAGTTLTAIMDGPVSNFIGIDETDAHFHIIGTTYDATFSGGALSDVFDVRAQAMNEVLGGGGDDTILIGTQLTPDDYLSGDEGNDLLILSPGPYASGTSMHLSQLHSINTMRLLAGGSYDFTEANALVSHGETMTVDASRLGGTEYLRFDGSLETGGGLILKGGKGDDTLIGGSGKDEIYAGAGTNTLKGGLSGDSIHCGVGEDTIAYNGASDSTGTAGHDTIFNFDGAIDHFSIPTSVSAVDRTIKGGSFSEASFDANVAAAVSTLGAFHAVVWQPLSGTAILVVDTNGVAGYQAGVDFAVEFVNATGIGHILNG